MGQVTTSTGKKKREASHLVETHPKNTPVVTLDGTPIDFNEIIAPSRVNKIIFIEDRTKFFKLLFFDCVLIIYFDFDVGIPPKQFK